MDSRKPRSKVPGESSATRTNVSGLSQAQTMTDTLPMGTLKRGRRPKGPSPFTKNFIKLLQEKACSHRRAAEIAGVSPSVISGWTAGSIPNDPSALLKITDELGADFQFVLTGVPADTISERRLGEIFEIEDQTNLSGIFQLEVKRLRFRKQP